MAFVLDLTPSPPVEATIDTGNGSFALTIDHPGFEHRLTESVAAFESICPDPIIRRQAVRSRWLNRLTLVSGWRGITDNDGNEISFSTENLLRLLNKCPSTIDPVADELAKMFVIEPVESHQESDAGEVAQAAGESVASDAV